jgi:hypothetical protein
MGAGARTKKKAEKKTAVVNLDMKRTTHGIVVLVSIRVITTRRWRARRHVRRRRTR